MTRRPFGDGTVVLPTVVLPTVVLPAAVWLLTFAGCSQQSPERPGYADLSCQGAKCSSGKGGSGGVVASPQTTSAAPGGSSSGSPADSGAGAASLLSLDPQEATELERTLGAPVGRPYSLFAWPDDDDPTLRSQGQMAEETTLSESGQWLLVVVTDDTGVADSAWLPTLTWQLPDPDPVVLPLFRRALWEDLAAGLVTNPTSLDPGAGHVLVKVVDQTGQPMIGVSAQAGTGTLAYGTGGYPTDALTETDESGVIAWFNTPVGDGTTLTLASAAGDSWTFPVPTRPSTVSVVAVAR